MPQVEINLLIVAPPFSELRTAVVKVFENNGDRRKRRSKGKRAGVD